jgi:hypothetical protein
MRVCRICGRERHKGLCDMATLEDGRSVHTKRIDPGGDLHGDVIVKNRWIKKDLLKKEKGKK